MTEATLRPDMTMEEILRSYPSAQRALFHRYHVGGCSSCGYQPTDTLAQVCKDHNILDVNEVIHTIQRSQDADERLQVSVSQVKEWLDAGAELRLLDVRQPAELELAPLDAAEPLDFQNSQKYMSLPKETRLVFACKSGQRSLDVAAYFAGHGFTNVFSMRGGIDAWRAEVDPSVPNS